MSYRLPSLTVVSALATAALCCVMVGSAQAAGRGRGKSIEFSEPKSDEVTTNLHQLNSKKDSLKQLEEDLYRSIRTFSGGSSLDGVPAPPVRPPAGPVIPSKRARELLDRHKNAYLMTPEDLVSAPTLEEIFELPEYDEDGLEKKKKTPMELYYERLDAKRVPAVKPAQPDNEESLGEPRTFSGLDRAAPEIEPMLPPGLKETQDEIQQYLAAEIPDTAPVPTMSIRSSYSDIFGLGELAPSPEKVLEHKKLMDEFQSILQPSRLPSASAEGGSLLGSSPESPSQAANPFRIPEATTGVDPQFGAVNPVLTPSGPADVNEQMLSRSSPIQEAPKVTPSRPPSAPTFTAPRRPF